MNANKTLNTCKSNENFLILVAYGCVIYENALLGIIKYYIIKKI